MVVKAKPDLYRDSIFRLVPRLDTCISVPCFKPVINVTLHGVCFIVSLTTAPISSRNPPSAGTSRGNYHTQGRDEKYTLYYELPFILPNPKQNYAVRILQYLVPSFHKIFRLGSWVPFASGCCHVTGSEQWRLLLFVHSGQVQRPAALHNQR
jgi:hypothetical protein